MNKGLLFGIILITLLASGQTTAGKFTANGTPP